MKPWIVIALASAMATPAAAHVRPPWTISLQVRDDQHLLAGTTFGLVTSDDGGVTWRWTCEQALHYGDPFDPDYAYATDGTILEQTTVQTWLKHDSCGDDSQPFDGPISGVEASPDGALWATAYDGTIYRAATSTAMFQPVTSPASVTAWSSLEVSPTDPQRVYLAGFRFGTTTKEHLLFVSTNGGAAWSPMSTTGMPTNTSSLLYIAGIGPATDTVYIYSPFEDDQEQTAAIYKSTNAGATWTKIFTSHDPFLLAFLVRASGELVVATRASGAWHSTDGGASWLPLVGAPHISALVETPSGEVWAGTQPGTQLPPGMNQSLPTIEGDGYLLMHSADLVTWKPGLAMQDIQPTACGTGSPVRQACFDMHYDLGTAWCCLVGEYRVDPGDLDCRGANWCGGFQDAGVAGDATPPSSNPGCCQTGGGDPSALGILSVIQAVCALRRRRRRGQRR